MVTNRALIPPYPYFGGKRMIAAEVWVRMGHVNHFIEPFFGAGAVLLARPNVSGKESINDINGYVANFWRAVQAEPDAVATYADWPINENDLHARHLWLCQQNTWLQPKLESDPFFYDTRIAGWWVWGMCLWIGGEFCEFKSDQKTTMRQKPRIKDKNGILSQPDSYTYINKLANRIKHVNVLCGDWQRICTPLILDATNITGLFLDPPYGDVGRDNRLYGKNDSYTVAEQCLQWCIENTGNARLRIALCGYNSEHNVLEALGWIRVDWKANGGYGRSNGNEHRESIWFSPHCLNSIKQIELFT